jgi:hypothetical protein
MQAVSMSILPDFASSDKQLILASEMRQLSENAPPKNGFWARARWMLLYLINHLHFNS